MPVDSATTFVRRVLTERSLRTLRPPSFLDSSAVWIALSTCVCTGVDGWGVCGQRVGLMGGVVCVYPSQTKKK